MSDTTIIPIDSIDTYNKLKFPTSHFMRLFPMT